MKVENKCSWHAKRARGAASAAPAQQNEAAPKAINRRWTSADKVLQVLHLTKAVGHMRPLFRPIAVLGALFCRAPHRGLP